MVEAELGADAAGIVATYARTAIVCRVTQPGTRNVCTLPWDDIELLIYLDSVDSPCVSRDYHAAITSIRQLCWSNSSWPYPSSADPRFDVYLVGVECAYHNVVCIYDRRKQHFVRLGGGHYGTNFQKEGKPHMVHSDIIDYFQHAATKTKHGDLVHKCRGGVMYHHPEETFVMRFVPNATPLAVAKIVDSDDDEIEVLALGGETDRELFDDLPD
uniref:Uncharacterized protein n=1 Tax=Marseillevirus LCMAC103 TaxID=2506604 RepID=A0A481YUR4_9VIRU|nr:MAG: hypothetical protein LCMAC103_02600 [Marseillevirus LCMAC103]